MDCSWEIHCTIFDTTIFLEATRCHRYSSASLTLSGEVLRIASVIVDSPFGGAGIGIPCASGYCSPTNMKMKRRQRRRKPVDGSKMLFVMVPIQYLGNVRKVLSRFQLAFPFTSFVTGLVVISRGSPAGMVFLMHTLWGGENVSARRKKPVPNTIVVSMSELSQYTASVRPRYVYEIQ